MTAPEPELAAFLREAGLASRWEDGVWTPLTGGVSSDIWRVRLRRGDICVKRARAQLKVAADWWAPVDRNAHEWDYLQVAAEVAPGHVPRPFAHDPARGLFAMAWLPPEQHRLWKTELLAGRVNSEDAVQVGCLLGKLHAATAGQADIARRFATDSNFKALRIEPYLLATARRHPELALKIRAIATATIRNHQALVHGDVSPKNILLGPAGPVLLDAECAWYGDPAFDLAFCLNHLAIKARVVLGAKGDLVDAFGRLKAAYAHEVTWEPFGTLERRAAALLPVLALARVDGKSPVEYLDTRQRCELREVATDVIGKDLETLDQALEGLLA